MVECSQVRINTMVKLYRNYLGRWNPIFEHKDVDRVFVEMGTRVSDPKARKGKCFAIVNEDRGTPVLLHYSPKVVETADINLFCNILGSIKDASERHVFTQSERKFVNEIANIINVFCINLYGTASSESFEMLGKQIKDQFDLGKKYGLRNFSSLFIEAIRESIIHDLLEGMFTVNIKRDIEKRLAERDNPFIGHILDKYSELWRRAKFSEFLPDKEYSSVIEPIESIYEGRVKFSST